MFSIEHVLQKMNCEHKIFSVNKYVSNCSREKRQKVIACSFMVKHVNENTSVDGNDNNADKGL